MHYHADYHVECIILLHIYHHLFEIAQDLGNSSLNWLINKRLTTFVWFCGVIFINSGHLQSVQQRSLATLTVDLTISSVTGLGQIFVAIRQIIIMYATQEQYFHESHLAIQFTNHGVKLIIKRLNMSDGELNDNQNNL